MEDLDKSCRELRMQIKTLTEQLRGFEQQQRALGKRRCIACGDWFDELIEVIIDGSSIPYLVYEYCPACMAREQQRERESQLEWARVAAGEIKMTFSSKWRKSRPGCVYIIHNQRSGYYKIGATSSSLTQRVKTYWQGKDKDQCPLVMVLLTRDAFELEHFLHFRFRSKREDTNELFTLTGEDVDMLMNLETSQLFPYYQPLRVVHSIDEGEAWIESAQSAQVADIG